jgi:hypothetical protein
MAAKKGETINLTEDELARMMQEFHFFEIKTGMDQKYSKYSDGDMFVAHENGVIIVKFSIDVAGLEMPDKLTKLTQRMVINSAIYGIQGSIRSIHERSGRIWISQEMHPQTIKDGLPMAAS